MLERIVGSGKRPLVRRAAAVLAWSFFILWLAAPVAFAQTQVSFDDPTQFPFVPVFIQSVVKGIIAWAFINAFKAVGDVFHRDISGWAGLFAVGLGGALLYVLNGMIGAQPESTQQALSYFAQLLMALVFAMGFKRTEVKLRMGQARVAAPGLPGSTPRG